MNFNKTLRVWEQRVPNWKRVGGIHFRQNAKKVSVFKALKPALKTLTFIIQIAKSSRLRLDLKCVDFVYTLSPAYGGGVCYIALFKGECK